MPINSLESFLFERKLVNVSPVEILQNSTLGIDVEHYLGRIYTFKKEQLLSGIGGTPMSLKAYIESDLAVFREYSIRPLFIFPGLHVQRNNDLKANELTESEAHRDLAWTRLNAKIAASSGTPSTHFNESFRSSNEPISSRPMMNDLIKYFIEFGIDYLVCPSDPSFQLSYMYQSGVVDCVYGSTDLLITQIDKFILGMEFLSKDFRFVDKPKVLYELGFTENQLIDVSIIVGCSAQPCTFSSLPPMPKHNTTASFQQMTHFKYALDLMYQYKTFHNEVDLYPYVAALNDETLLSLYFKGKAAVKYMPVMNIEGSVGLYLAELIKTEEFSSSKVSQEDLKMDVNDAPGGTPELLIPNEIHEVVSQRLPSEIFFYFSLGLLPFRILESIVSSGLRVRPPLHGPSCEEFKQMISSQFTIKMLDAQINLVTQLLARYYQMKKVPLRLWFSDEEENLNTRMNPSVSERLNSWMVSNNSKAFSLLKIFASRAQSEEALSSNITDSTHIGDMVGTAVLRSFALLDDCKPGLSMITTINKILCRIVERYPKVASDVLEDLIILIILIRLGFFPFASRDKSHQSVANIFKMADQGIDQLDSNRKIMISVISRVFSFRKLRINAINYQGPISRSLLDFWSHHQFIRQLIGDSVRLCLVDTITRSSSFKLMINDRGNWYHIVDQLPFFKEANNTLLGVMSEIYFDGCLKRAKTDSDDESCALRSMDHLLNYVMQLSNTTFNMNLASTNSATSEQVTEDLKSGAHFWKVFVSALDIGSSIDGSFFEDSLVSTVSRCDQVVSRFAIP